MTKGGKELTIEADGSNACYKIKFVKGGELPAELSGMYTKRSIAQTAIDQYLIRKG